MSLFFYTRKVQFEATAEHPAGEAIYTDSFNLNKVIRSIQISGNELLILLDDLHERAEQVPDVKNGKVIGQKRERNTYQTEIRLTDGDIERFNNLNK